jgi:hypothetical protein
MPSHDTNSFDLPHPVLTKIGDANTEPTFATNLVNHIELNANAASVYSSRGDGLSGHLALTINTVDYESRCQGNLPFNKPVNPPTVPAHKDNTTEVDIAEDNRQHKALRLEFVLWHNVDAVPRNLLIAAVPAIFIAAKKNTVTGFSNVTCLELLTHLHNNYGKITEQELKDNVTRMRAQWNPPTAIESLFVQIEDGVSFAAEGNNETTKPTTLRWAFDIVAKTGHYDLACQEWRKFKLRFKAADRDMRSQETTGTDVYHGANAATSDATLLATTQAALAASNMQLAQAISQACLFSSSSGTNFSTETTTTRVSALTNLKKRPHAHCWTHGHTANLDHTSTTCQYPDDGHQVAATATNRMGGTNAIYVPHRPRPGR